MPRRRIARAPSLTEGNVPKLDRYLYASGKRAAYGIESIGDVRSKATVAPSAMRATTKADSIRSWPSSFDSRISNLAERSNSLIGGFLSLLSRFGGLVLHRCKGERAGST